MKSSILKMLNQSKIASLSLIVFSLINIQLAQATPSPSPTPTPSIPSISLDCSNTTCTPNFTPVSAHDGSADGGYTAINVGQNTSNINVFVDNQQTPRNLRMNVFNGAFPSGAQNPGYNLSVNLNSSTSSSNAGSVIILGDNFNNLDIDLNGYSGGSGQNASNICAQNFLNGTYGPDSQNFFTTLRTNNPSISSSACVQDDVNYLQNNKFQCDSGFTQIFTGNSSVYSVTVEQIPTINRCQAALDYNICLRRMMDVSCEWAIYNGNGNFTADLSSGSAQLVNAYTVNGSITAGISAITSSTNANTIAIGQPVIGNGIPANTSVVGINGSTIQLSQAPTNTTSGEPFLIGVVVGQTVFATVGIPTETTVAAISPDGTIISLSDPVTITNTAVALTSAAETDYATNIDRIMPENEYYYLSQIMSPSDLCNLHIANDVSTTNYVPQGSTSSFTGNTIQTAFAISNVSNLTASITTGSTQVIYTTLPPGIIAGQPLYGQGISDNTIIESISNSVITLSTPATQTITNDPLLVGPQIGQTLSGSGIPPNDSGPNSTPTPSPSPSTGSVTTTITAIVVGGTTTAVTAVGSQTVSTIPDTSFFVVGEPITGNNFGNATIISITDANDIEISVPATSDGPDTLTFTNTVIMSQPANYTQTGISVVAASNDPIINPVTSNANSYAGCNGGCFWQVKSTAAVLTTPGMVGNQLAPGSDWQLITTAPGQQCDTSTNVTTGFYTTYQTVNVNYVAYDPTSSACNASDIVTYSGGVEDTTYPAASIDPNEQAVWFYTGTTQEPDFGTIAIECDLGSCPVNSVVSDLTQSFSTITPTSGQSGTQQGSGIVLIYDAATLPTPQASPGLAGAGGQNDLVDQATTNVCVKILDASTQGINSSYAKTPQVSFNQYNWQALNIGPSGSPGSQAVSNGGTVSVWKKIDYSVRAFVQNELFSQ
jgi:hypothetical protein